MKQSLLGNVLLFGLCLLPNWIIHLSFWHVVQTRWLLTQYHPFSQIFYRTPTLFKS